MDEEQLPPTQPSGSLEPPRRPPPTAVATSAPVPPEPLSGPVRWLPAHRQTAFGRMIDRALDALDELGDTVRRVLTRT